MDRPEALARLNRARTGHLGTVRPDGRPHVVVVVFAVVGETIVTALDHKPKRTNRLQRLINIDSNPTVSFLVDHYDEDWQRLWWTRVDGPATIHDHDETGASARSALIDKYPQYRDRPPAGPVISIVAADISSWAGTP